MENALIIGIRVPIVLVVLGLQQPFAIFWDCKNKSKTTKQKNNQTKI